MKYLLILLIGMMCFWQCAWDLNYINEPPPDDCWTQQICQCGKDLLYDSRDGQVYTTVWIDIDGGNDINKSGQCWMAENLNIGDFVDDRFIVKDDSIIQKFCNHDDPSKCADHGGYYTWVEARNYSKLSSEKKVQGICPNGWHLPSKEEFQVLIEAVDTNFNALWIFGNTSGFSAKLCGSRGHNSALAYANTGFRALFWSSTIGDISGASYVLFLNNTSGQGEVLLIDNVNEASVTVGNCIRCIQG